MSGVFPYFYFFILNHSVQSGFGNDFDLKNPPCCTTKLLVGGETWELDSFICLDQAFPSPWPGFTAFVCNSLTKAIKWPLHSKVPRLPLYFLTGHYKRVLSTGAT